MSVAQPSQPMRGTTRRKLAINALRERDHLAEQDVDAFLHDRQVPIIEGAKCTFLSLIHI